MKFLKGFLVTLYTFGIFFYMSYVLVDQQTRINELNVEITDKKREIQEQYFEIEKLDARLSSMSEDSYMEEVAREHLGLVMPTEIIFMDASI